MSLRNVCIEVRKNLRCANIFLQFECSLNQSEPLKINVDRVAIRLKQNNSETQMQVQKYFAIEANTLCNLTVEDLNASLRVTIDENAATQTNALDDQPRSAQRQSSLAVLQLAFQAGQSVALLCSNCLCSLMDAHAFERILEFPTGAIDTGDFFCHHGPNMGAKLLPKQQDFCYGFEFVVLNALLLGEGRLQQKDQQLYCKRCLQHIGGQLCAGAAVKLWADAVQLQATRSVPSPENLKETMEVEEVVDVFTNPKLERSTCRLLQRIISESSLPGEPLHQLQFSKVLLETVFPDRSTGYLMLHILEQQLHVLRNAQPLHCGVEAVSTQSVELEHCYAYKLLYRLTEERPQPAAQKANTPLLAFWKHDITIHLMQISPKLFNELLEELEENSLLLPERYRYNEQQFKLSYVFYEV